MSDKYYWQDEKTIDVLVRILREEKIAITTTDTIIGLLAPATQKGFSLLNKAKNRYDKLYLVLAKDIDYAMEYVHPDKKEMITKIAHQCWPGPVTLIVPAAPGVPGHIVSVEKTIALRVPDYAFLQKLLEHFGILFSTSANCAGQPVAQRFSELDPFVLAHVSLLVHDRNERVETIASTILDCSQEQVRVIRAGAFPVDTLENVLGYIPS